MSQGGGKEFNFHSHRNIIQSPVGFLADALETHSRPPSSTWYSLSCLVLKNICMALLLLSVFIFYTIIHIISVLTWKHMQVTNETLRRSRADLSSCSIWSWCIPPDCVSYNTKNQGMIITGHCIQLANLRTLLISTLPSVVFKSQR